MTIQANEHMVEVGVEPSGTSFDDQVRLRVDEKRVKSFAKAALGDSFTHDNYFAKMMSDEKTARLFFELFLPRKILRQIDLESLRAMPTKYVDERGNFRVGDMFYSIETKRRKGKKSRRAVFMLILEHKSDHERYVAIQLLDYIAGMLRFMSANPEEYQDENGFLPAPYAMVFSQAKKPWKRVPYLRRILWTIRGFKRTIPNFIFPVVEASEIPLERIKKLEPVARVFLYMERLAKREYEKGENQELIELFSDLFKASNRDERLRQAFYASIAYLRYLQKGRPHTMSMQELQNGIFGQDGYDEYAILEEVFPNALERKYEQGRVNNIYDVILRNYRYRYAVPLSESLEEKIETVSYYPALEEIQLAILGADTPDAFERQVEFVIEKYAEEIKALNKNEKRVTA